MKIDRHKSPSSQSKLHQLYYALIIFLTATGEVAFYLNGPVGTESHPGASTTLFLGFVGLHFIWGLKVLIDGIRKASPTSKIGDGGRLPFSRMPETLFSLGLMLFLFAYIFASNDIYVHYRIPVIVVQKGI